MHFGLGCHHLLLHCYHLSKYLTSSELLLIQTRELHRFQASHWPGSPGVCVDVEGSDGSSKKRRGLIEPQFHIGTGVPLVLSIHHTVIAKPSQYTYTLLWHKKHIILTLAHTRKHKNLFNWNCTCYFVPLKVKKIICRYMQSYEKSSVLLVILSESKF